MNEIALHSLAGSGGTFGYTTSGNAARAMEFALEPFVVGETVPEAMRDPLSSMLDRLSKAAEAPDRPRSHRADSIDGCWTIRTPV
ncbi:MAG: hypothetical protein A3H32_16505 [Betaproteobacteria bacterium RIFCSPLOWO2_02_FULL_63_19]|nr:MAG: hypothetical protein A3H32_16505 [Betaproteobacteria bacterium RIFCSPLOWO2_02_FULL_63_19]